MITNDSPEAIELMEEVATIMGENLHLDPNMYLTKYEYVDALDEVARKIMEHIRDTMFCRIRS